MHCVNYKISNSNDFEDGGISSLVQMQQWINNSEIDEIGKYLVNLKNSERDFLLCWGVLNESSRSCNFRGHLEKALQKPSPLVFDAVTKNKFLCLRVLLDNGFSLKIKDPNGWNILHYLIAISHNDPSYEERAVAIWTQLLKILEEHQLVEWILKQDDLTGLRPVELALHLDCISLFDHIINTPEEYLAKTTQTGLWETRLYDITEYESHICTNNRRSKSLPLLACHVDRKMLANKVHTNVFHEGMMRRWAAAKITINFVPLILWFVLRFTAFIAFYVVVSTDLPLYSAWSFTVNAFYGFFVNLNFSLSTEEEYGIAIAYVLSDNETYSNETRATLLNLVDLYKTLCQPVDWYNAIEVETFFWTCFYFIIFYCFLTLTFDLVDIILTIFKKWYRWRFAFGKKKDIVNSSVYYRVCQFTFCAMILIWGFAYYYAPESDLASYGVLPTVYVSVWTILYFMQMLPSLGHFVNSIQKMLTIMLQFIVVYVFILIPYPHAFQVLLTRNNVGQCQAEGFTTAPEAWYSTFKIMLNMVDLGKYHSSGLQPANILHIVYVFTVAILLVNFFIALLATSVGETVEAGNVIMMLQRLSVVTVLERRLQLLCPCYYSFMQKFVYKCRGGKIYLEYHRFAGVERKTQAFLHDV